jgi:mannose-6-phosphate isomerase
MRVERLECPIRESAWGSRSEIARIQGRPVPSPHPEAELWAGAHPAAPSLLGRVPLSERVAADPTGTLGPEIVARFGPRLPYLLKLLAAVAPLSLQVHPDPVRAAEGYAADEASGLAPDAPCRRYVDPYHKPELLVAVSRFRTLCGFAQPAVSAARLARLGLPALAPAVSQLRAGDLGTALAELLAAPPALVSEVAVAAAGLGDRYALVGELAAAYPGDPGVIAALLLNRVTLAPGEAIFIPAGNLHAHLSGTGVEIMAASDNVLRGGLTSKQVDIPELLRVVHFDWLADPVVAPVPVAPGVVTWPVPVPDFALHRVTVEAEPVVLPVAGPRTVLCLAGEVEVDDSVESVTLGGGQAAFGAAAAAGRSATALTVRGRGQVFVGSAGSSARPVFAGSDV